MKKKIIPLFCAFLLLLMMQPYFVWGAKLTAIKFLFFLLIIPYLKFRKKIEIQLLILIFFAYFIIPIHREQNLIGIAEFVLLSLIPFIKDRFVYQTFCCFSIIYATINAISLIVWGLVWSGMNLPGEIIEPLNELKPWKYIAYPFLVIPTKVELTENNMLQFFRFHGVFDEPGVIGTISLILLYVHSFNLKKWYNIVTFVSGIVSFSLFFYLTVVLYYIIVLFQRGKLRFYHLLVTTMGVVGLYVLVTTVPIFYDMIGRRIEYDKSTGMFAGDNRAEKDLIMYVQSIRGTSRYFWGDTNANIIRFSGSAGYRNIILRYGAVFYMLFIVFWLLYAISICKNRNDFIVFLVLFIAVQYQRPSPLGIEYLFLFTAFVKCYNNQYEIGNGYNWKNKRIGIRYRS